jgi:Tfp pilus assembly protein PilO
MNYTQKVLALIGGAVLLLAVFFLAVYLPRSGELGRLMEEAKVGREQIAEIELKKARLPQVMAEIADLETRIKRLNEQYPRTIDPIYRDIDRVAQEAGLKILRMVTEGRPARDPALMVRESDISLESQSSVQVLGEFLHGITVLPVTLSVTALKISREETVPVAQKFDQLKTEMHITAYLSQEETSSGGNSSKQ